MLLKNGVIYELDKDKDIEPLKKSFKGKFPVVLKIREQFFYKDRDPENKRATNPSVMLQLSANFHGPTGLENWRYCESMVAVPGQHGIYNYTPTILQVSNRLMIEEKDIQLLWFLYHCCPQVTNNAVKAKSNTPYFEFEDAELEASQKIIDIKLENKVRFALFDDKLAYPTEKVRTIAKAFNIGDTDTMEDGTLRLKLLNRIMEHRHKTRNLQEFEKLTKVDSNYTGMRELVRKAMDAGLIKTHSVENKRYWFFTNEDKKPTDKICGLLDKHNGKEHERLVNHLLENADHLDRLRLAVEKHETVTV